MKDLRDNLPGEGNANKCISKKEKLRSSLQYNYERSLTFKTFLTKCQEMFNIYGK